MFTGIIEEIGVIHSIRTGEKSFKLLIKAHRVLENTRVGDSICTNGVCLTVTGLNSDAFEADVMAETLRRSNLGELHKGNRVNLERALRFNSRLGGHIVSGHIDGIGRIVSLDKEDNATWVTIRAHKNILKYIVCKGSIAIDGISLTVANLGEEEFMVSIIPHTGEETILLKKKIGDTVNLECDLVGKYVEKLLGIKGEHIGSIEEKNKPISQEFLKNNGFL